MKQIIYRKRLWCSSQTENRSLMKQYNRLGQYWRQLFNCHHVVYTQTQKVQSTRTFSCTRPIDTTRHCKASHCAPILAGLMPHYVPEIAPDTFYYIDPSLDTDTQNKRWIINACDVHTEGQTGTEITAQMLPSKL